MCVYTHRVYMASSSREFSRPASSQRPLVPSSQRPLVPPNFLDTINDGSSLAAAAKPADAGLAADLQLYHYQLQALQWMVGRERALDGIHGGILGDEQGTGKTVMCAALVASHRCDDLRPQVRQPQAPLQAQRPLGSEARKCGATLICCTPVIEGQWKEELARHAPGLKVVRFDPGAF